MGDTLLPLLVHPVKIKAISTFWHLTSKESTFRISITRIKCEKVTDFLQTLSFEPTLAVSTNSHWYLAHKTPNL